MSIIKWLDENLERMILTILLASMTLLMGYQIIMRYIFNNSLSWSEELTKYMFVWSSFISIGYCIKHGISIKIDQGFNAFPAVLKKPIRIFNKILMLGFFAFLTYYSFDVVRASMVSGQRSPALGIPIYLVQASTLVGFSIAFIRVLQSILGVFKEVKEV